MKTMMVKGKKYILKNIVHDRGDDTFELIPFNESEYNKIIGDIVKAVKHTVNPDEAVKQALTNLEFDEVLEIHKALYKKKQKPKSVKGCYEIIIGGHSIPLVS